MKILLWDIRHKKKGMTLEKLAEKCGISKSTLQRIEKGEVSPTMDTMEKLAIALEVSIFDLFESEQKYSL